MLRLTQVSIRRGARLLLEGIDLRIHPGQKAGVIGANGSGKSSLFSVILGELAPETGEAVDRVAADCIEGGLQGRRRKEPA